MQVCTSHQTDNHASTPPFFTGRMPIPAAQPTASKHWRQFKALMATNSCQTVVCLWLYTTVLAEWWHYSLLLRSYWFLISLCVCDDINSLVLLATSLNINLFTDVLWCRCCFSSYWGLWFSWLLMVVQPRCEVTIHCPIENQDAHLWYMLTNFQNSLADLQEQFTAVGCWVTNATCLDQSVFEKMCFWSAVECDYVYVWRILK